ncbi:leucine--tRNA ligase [candidate division GN15 bacterium]|nr:leucine--tRNA ligase [candidate division GN15 bacterium]
MPTAKKTIPEYDFTSIEQKWQQAWEDQQLFKAPENPDPANKFYMLVMFAYPSGDIHMGHFRNYIIGDAVARQQMMKGKAVLHPFGWDAFGLPAERAAIKRDIHPAEWTRENIKVSRETLQKVGISYDWSREVASCEPDYYKWTQWIFARMFEAGLAFQQKTWVNWDPVDKTVLANEQVINGYAERSGAKVEKKELVGWYFRITKYADQLIDDLDKLPDWPENVKTMQREWIGRSEGLEVDFTIEETGEKLPIFTTRPDTIYGVTYMAVAPEADLLNRLNLDPEAKAKVEAYKQEAMARTDIDRAAATGDKDGVFTGKYAINPFNGERIPLWVADYVLAHYGTGAVMAVPAHDTRDFAFAKKYDIPIKVVIIPDAGSSLDPGTMDDAFTDYGPMINSGPFDGKAGAKAIDGVAAYAEEKGIGRRQTNYKLKDWSISRQRYWGCPIPIIHCDKCGPQAVPDDQLPVMLPTVSNYIPKGRSPLADVPEFTNTTCPRCGGEAQRDPDTMDTFVCSSWYHLRYADAHNDEVMADPDKVNAWLPIDLYVGGITHATGHLIYFRFFQKVLRDLGILKHDEPATKLFNHGMVADANGEVMSKSKGNVVSPIALMENRGVDISRLAMFFTAPSEKPVMWSDDTLTGVEKFAAAKLYPMVAEYRESNPNLKRYFNDSDNLTDAERPLYIKLNQTIKRASEGFDKLQFNTAIAALMELVRDYDPEQIGNDELNDYVILKTIQLIAPLAPHMAEEMWQLAGFEESVFKSAWPEYDPEAIVGDMIELAVQVNGKLRDTVQVPADCDQLTAEETALVSEKVQRHIEGKQIIKKIFVPGRLINIVVKG